jgi:hypothetical protein
MAVTVIGPDGSVTLDGGVISSSDPTLEELVRTWTDPLDVGQPYPPIEDPDPTRPMDFVCVCVELMGRHVTVEGDDLPWEKLPEGATA